MNNTIGKWKWLPSVFGWATIISLIHFQYGEPYYWLTRIGLALTAAHALLVFSGLGKFSFWYNLAVLTIFPLAFDVGLGFLVTPGLLVFLLIRSAVDRHRRKRAIGTVEDGRSI